jgi:hypothetical protein
MKRKIGLKELHRMASQMKYYDFENWVAKELFDQPSTVDTSELTDKLFLYNVVGLSEHLKDFLDFVDIRYKHLGTRDKIVDEFLSL